MTMNITELRKFEGVCEWDDDFEKLETLLKEASETLFIMYQKRLEELS